MITIPKGKFLCGLYGCTQMVSSAHQAKHALEEHDMDIRAYKDARLAMRKGNRGMIMATGPATEEPPTPAPSNTDKIYKKSDEEFKPSLDEKIVKSRTESNVGITSKTFRHPEQQHKTPESMPFQETEAYQTIDEPETESHDDFRGTKPEPMINEESLKLVREKEEAENKLKALAQNQRAAQNEKYEPKEIIKVIILRCPHCGGALKNE